MSKRRLKFITARCLKFICPRKLTRLTCTEVNGHHLYLQVAQELRERYFGSELELQSDELYKQVWAADAVDTSTRPSGAVINVPSRNKTLLLRNCGHEEASRISGGLLNHWLTWHSKASACFLEQAVQMIVSILQCAWSGWLHVMLPKLMRPARFQLPMKAPRFVQASGPASLFVYFRSEPSLACSRDCKHADENHSPQVSSVTFPRYESTCFYFHCSGCLAPADVVLQLNALLSNSVDACFRLHSKSKWLQAEGKVPKMWPGDYSSCLIGWKTSTLGSISCLWPMVTHCPSCGQP